MNRHTCIYLSLFLSFSLSIYMCIYIYIYSTIVRLSTLDLRAQTGTKDVWGHHAWLSDELLGGLKVY